MAEIKLDREDLQNLGTDRPMLPKNEPSVQLTKELTLSGRTDARLTLRAPTVRASSSAESTIQRSTVNSPVS